MPAAPADTRCPQCPAVRARAERRRSRLAPSPPTPAPLIVPPACRPSRGASGPGPRAGASSRSATGCASLYGRPSAPPHRQPLDELILTVLSQSTNDRNRDVAFLRLRQRFPSWSAVRDAPNDEVEAAIRPGGISRVKSLRIQDILRALDDPPSLDHLADLTHRTGPRRADRACPASAARPPPACCCSRSGCRTSRSTRTSRASARGSACSAPARRSRSCTTTCSRSRRAGRSWSSTSTCSATAAGRATPSARSARSAR